MQEPRFQHIETKSNGITALIHLSEIQFIEQTPRGCMVHFKGSDRFLTVDDDAETLQRRIRKEVEWHYDQMSRGAGVKLLRGITRFILRRT